MGSGADIVLLDIGLPQMDGYEVARRLRATGCTSALIALTGYGQADDVKRAGEAASEIVGAGHGAPLTRRRGGARGRRRRARRASNRGSRRAGWS
jgi:CheY-like chemotaxis protein